MEEAVQQLQLSDFRSSEKMKLTFGMIIERYIVPQAYFLGDSSTLKRLDSMMHLLVEFLNLPQMSTMLGIGTWYSSSRNDKSLLLSLQFLLLQGLNLFTVGEQLRDGDGSIEAEEGEETKLNAARVDLVVNLVLFRVSAMVPIQLTISENCPAALRHISCHVLCVRALSKRITDRISRITAKLVESFGHSKTDSYESYHEILSKHFTSYVNWLGQHKKELARSCRNNEVIASLNPAARAWLKSEEYTSSALLIQMFQRKYRPYLRFIPVPLQSSSREDILQAIKDIQRERVIINKCLYPRNSSSSCDGSSDLNDRKFECIREIKKKLINTLTFLSGRDIPAHIWIAEEDSLKEADSYCRPRLKSASEELRSVLNKVPMIENSSRLSAYTNGDARRNRYSELIDADQRDFESRMMLPRLLTLLVQYILLAASRSAASGDAFVIVEDVYGGEGTMLTPACVNQGQELKGNLTSISICPAGVKVVLKDYYHLYDSSQLDATRDLKTLTPIMKFRCTTTTLINFRAVSPTTTSSSSSSVITSPQSVFSSPTVRVLSGSGTPRSHEASVFENEAIWRVWDENIDRSCAETAQPATESTLTPATASMPLTVISWESTAGDSIISATTAMMSTLAGSDSRVAYQLPAETVGVQRDDILLAIYKQLLGFPDYLVRQAITIEPMLPS